MNRISRLTPSLRALQRNWNSVSRAQFHATSALLRQRRSVKGGQSSDPKEPSSISVPTTSWLNSTSGDDALSDPKSTEHLTPEAVERLFMDSEVRQFLERLTGFDLAGKVFAKRRTRKVERANYALMTDRMLEESTSRLQLEARNFLRPVPFKEPRPNSFEILSSDPEIAGFDTARFVFTDINCDATDQNRVVVVREGDGVLRTATPEEHDRMNRVFYEKPDRPPITPSIFKDPDLTRALDAGRHEHVLDWAAWFFEPDDPAFMELSKSVYNRVIEKGEFEKLYSTRHFQHLVFYAVLNGHYIPLMNYYGKKGQVEDVATLIRLTQKVYPDWRTDVDSTDSDREVVEKFLQRNKRFQSQLKDLLNFLRQSAGRGSGSEEKIVAAQ